MFTPDCRCSEQTAVGDVGGGVGRQEALVKDGDKRSLFWVGTTGGSNDLQLDRTATVSLRFRLFYSADALYFTHFVFPRTSIFCNKYLNKKKIQADIYPNHIQVFVVITVWASCPKNTHFKGKRFLAQPRQRKTLCAFVRGRCGCCFPVWPVDPQGDEDKQPGRRKFLRL